MKDIMDASLSASDKVTITAKLGELLLRQIGNPDAFMSELMKRYFKIVLALTAYQDIFKYFSLCLKAILLIKPSSHDVHRSSGPGPVKLCSGQ